MTASEPARRGRAVLSRDTSLAAEQRQVDIWRSMTPLEKAGLVSAASRAAQVLALAGIRRRYACASEEECMLSLARLKLGSELFARTYPQGAARRRP